MLLCQQTLAFGLLVAVAAPAADLVTLDIVGPGAPGVPAAGPAPAPGPAVTGRPAALGGAPSLVASAPVKPTVASVPLTGVTRNGLAALGSPTSRPADGAEGAARLTAAEGDPETDGLTVLSDPTPVAGLATVGVTWGAGVRLPDGAITVSVRTKDHGVWSAWQKVAYHEEEGPDPTSTEGEQARPGTDPIYVGNVDDVQVKAVTDSGDAPAGMRLAVVDPGTEKAPEVEKPAIDTGQLDLSAAETTPTTPAPGTDGTDGTDPAVPADGTTDGTTDAASLAAGAVTAKPVIYSRAQWGADERLRDKASLHYGEVHAGFVHHTVNANDYKASQVPAIIRGIYAYHTQSRGWSDVGYNFLVDRFGRIWEGRYGGVDRPVVGAHTLGYNDDAFAASAIGNFELVRPPAAVIDAYARLFAWKLSLHGVAAGGTHQWVTKRYLPAINGHRDVGQTACPGKYLYAKIPTIRSLAVGYQRSFTSRGRSTNLSGGRTPEIVVRNASTGRVSSLRTSGEPVRFHAPTVAATGLAGADLVVAVGDVTGDGRADYVVRNKTTKVSTVRAGDGPGHLSSTGLRPTAAFQHLDQLVGVGDWTGDGRNDVVGRNPVSHKLFLYAGDGRGGFGPRRLLASSWTYTATVGPGDFDGDGRPDLVATTAAGTLVRVSSTSTRTAGPRTSIGTGWRGYTLLSGGRDLTNDGRPDLVARRHSDGAVFAYAGTGGGRLAGRAGPFSILSGLRALQQPGAFVGSAANDVTAVDGSGRLLAFANNGGVPAGRVLATGATMAKADAILSVGDWDGDGHNDVVSRSRDSGSLYLYRGDGRGRLGAPRRIGTGWGSVRLLAAAGDMTGDGRPDLIGQPSGGSMRIYPGNGLAGLKKSYVAHSAITANRQVVVGRWTSDGAPDSLLRRSDGRMVLYPGNGPGGLTGGTLLSGTTAGYDWLIGVGDIDGDGRPDLVARDTATKRLWLLPGVKGGLGTRRLIRSGLSGYDLAG